MSVKLRISVTKNEYKKAVMCGVDESMIVEENCAIAMAICSIFPHAFVQGENILFYKDKSYGQWCKEVNESGDIYLPTPECISVVPLPAEAQEMILKFDGLIEDPLKRLELPELSFEIDVPDVVINEIGDIEEVKAIISQSPTLELVN